IHSCSAEKARAQTAGIHEGPIEAKVVGGARLAVVGHGNMIPAILNNGVRAACRNQHDNVLDGSGCRFVYIDKLDGWLSERRREGRHIRIKADRVDAKLEYALGVGIPLACKDCQRCSSSGAANGNRPQIEGGINLYLNYGLESESSVRAGIGERSVAW